MVRYDTDKELIDTAVKSFRDYLDSHTYQGISYDEKDEADFAVEYVSKKYGLTHGARVKRKTQRAKAKVGHVSTYQIPSAPDFGLPFRWMAEVTRSTLGLTSPIPLEELEEKLKEIEASIGRGAGTLVWCPTRDLIDGAHEGLHVWLVETRLLPDITPYITEPALKFRVEEAIQLISGWAHCHPALALAFLLCDRPLHHDIVTAVIDSFYHTSLYIRGPEVPMWLVRRITTFTRLITLARKRGKVVVGARPRATSDKISTLIDFVLHNKEQLSWKELLKKWNEDNKTWGFPNENTMKSTYYRAKPRLRIPKGGKK